MVPTRADRCCYVLYFFKSRVQAWELWIQRAIAQQNGTENAFTESRARGTEMEQRVLTRLRKDFQVGSEDWNDAAFTEQRIRWTQDSHNGLYIKVSPDKAIDELEEITMERNKKEDLHCTPSIVYRSLLGQVNPLQSRTLFQSCYTFSRCASMAASPTIGTVKSFN